MNIAVITSGGDSPGMNPCLAQVVKNAAKRAIRYMVTDADLWASEIRIL